MTKFAALFLFLFLGTSGCFITPHSMDNYCLDQCVVRFGHQLVVDAFWMGNDEFQGITRCECHLQNSTILGEYPYRPNM